MAEITNLTANGKLAEDWQTINNNFENLNTGKAEASSTYTKAEVDNIASGKSNTGHTHSNYLTGITKSQVTTALGYTPPTSDTVTTVTTTGAGNAVTSVTASNGALTVTKGSTFLTSHQDISGKANLSGATFTGNVSLSAGSINVQKGNLLAGSYTANTAQAGEYQVGAQSGAGKIYLYSSAATTGNRGLYSNNSAGTSKSVIAVDKDNNATFYGNASSASTATSATTATKLGSSTVGGTTTPIYLNAGTPTACSYTLAKSVPSNADFNNTWRPLCSTKPNTTSTASENAIAVVTENYLNGTEWYRVWSDGWKEQGGSLSNNKGAVTFKKAFTDTNYTVTLGMNRVNDTGGSYAPTIFAKSNTAMKIYASGGSVNYTSTWYACGY